MELILDLRFQILGPLHPLRLTWARSAKKSALQLGGRLHCQAAQGKVMPTSFQVSAGLPFSKNGLKIHCFAAAAAANWSSRGPSIGRTAITLPVVPTRIRNCTRPVIPALRAAWGYSGATRRTSVPGGALPNSGKGCSG